MVGIRNCAAARSRPVVTGAICFLMFATASGLQGCGNAPGSDQAGKAGIEPVRPPAETGDAQVMPSPAAVELYKISLFKVVNGHASALAGEKLGPVDRLRVTVELAGNSKQTALEIRVADTKGNGVFREARSLQVDGQASVTFEIPAPADGWKAGSYLTSVAIDSTHVSASSFLVR